MWLVVLKPWVGSGAECLSACVTWSEGLEDWSGSLKSGAGMGLKILLTLIVWDYDISFNLGLYKDKDIVVWLRFKPSPYYGAENSVCHYETWLAGAGWTFKHWTAPGSSLPTSSPAIVTLWWHSPGSCFWIPPICWWLLSLHFQLRPFPWTSESHV